MNEGMDRYRCVEDGEYWYIYDKENGDAWLACSESVDLDSAE